MATIIWMAHISADVTADGWTFATLFRAYGEWILPYVAGRLAIKTADDLKLLLPWVSGVVIALSLCAIVESLLGFNVVEMLFGDRPVAGFARNASRFGMKRAFVNTMHPIFFAIQLLILAPFCFGMIAKKSDWIRKMLAWVSLLLTALGISATVSRGPMLAFVMMLAVLVFITFRLIRWPVVIGLAILVVVVSVAPSATLNFLGEQVGERKTMVEIDGEAMVFSGTNNRFLIFSAYGDALRHAGLAGYGTKLTTGFPPNIPYLQTSRRSIEKLKYIDNAYVLLTLRFGFLGLCAFVFLMLSGIYTAVSLRKLTPDEPFYVAVCGGLIGFAAVMMTVWMSYDFGFIYLWMLGILAGCAVAPKNRFSPNSFNLVSVSPQSFRI